MISLRSLRSYPRGTRPPIHMPLRLEAAILSRIRSPVTSRSNCANDSSTFSVKRPIDEVVLNCCVTETKLTLSESNTWTILAKSARLRVSRSTLYTTTTSILRASMSASSCFRAGRSIEPPE
jgi:hypothetical protein